MSLDNTFSTIQKGSLEEVEAICSSTSFKRTLRDHEGNTPLHIAAQKGDERLVKLILKNHPPATKEEMDLIIKRNQLYKYNPWVIVKNKAGDTPLDLAVKGSHLHLIKSLNSRGGFDLPKYLRVGVDNPSLIEYAVRHKLYKLQYTDSENNLLNDAIEGCAPNVIKNLIGKIEVAQVCVEPKCYRVWLSKALKSNGSIESQDTITQEKDKESKELIINWAKEKLEEKYVGGIIDDCIEQGDREDIVKYFIEKGNCYISLVYDFVSHSIKNNYTELLDYFRQNINEGKITPNPSLFLRWMIESSENPSMQEWCRKKIIETKFSKDSAPFLLGSIARLNQYFPELAQKIEEDLGILEELTPGIADAGGSPNGDDNLIPSPSVIGRDGAMFDSTTPVG